MFLERKKISCPCLKSDCDTLCHPAHSLATTPILQDYPINYLYHTNKIHEKMPFCSCADIQVDCKEHEKLQCIYLDDLMTTLAITAIEDTVFSSVTAFSGLHA
jgi:hypothetical protein